MAFAQKNGTNYTPGFWLDGRKVYCKVKECGRFTDKASAQAHAEEHEAQAAAAAIEDKVWREENPNATDFELSPSQKAKLTLEDVWTRYCSEAGPTIELKTLESYSPAMRNRVLPVFGQRRPDAITNGAVATWLNTMKNRDRESASTIRNALLAFSSVMSFAVQQKIRTDGVNPCHGHKIEKVVREKREEEFELTPDQLQRLVAAFPTYGLQLATLVLAGTGCRFEELAALRVGCLDVKRCTIFIERRVTWPSTNTARGHHGGPVEHRNTKSKGVRKFKIRPQLVAQLDKWIKDNELKKGDLLFSYDLMTIKRLGHGYVDDSAVPELTEEFVATLGTLTAPNGFEYKHGTIGAATTGRCRCEYCQVARRRYDRARRVAQGRKPTAKVSPNPERYLRHETYLSRFHKAVAACGLDDELEWKPTPHCLRHTYITRLANAGVPLAEIQRRAGHEDIETTMGYVHPNGAADQAAADALGTEYDIDLGEVA